MAITKIPAAGFTGNNFRNIIINGDMSIAQRGTSESGISLSGGTYLLDRFEFVNVNVGTWTMSQDTDVPSAQGFPKSLKLDCTTANAAPAASDSLILRQIIEGQNLQYLKKGTANAESLTVSFWVKSNKTGTYILELYDADNTRQISKSYTIDSASTWEKKTLTFAGDTTGAFDNNNGASLYFQFWLGGGTDFTSGTLNTSWNSVTTANRAVGQVNLADNTANEFYITGVQLEAGTTASDFEFLPHDVNLDRCFRYYEILADTSDVRTIGTGNYYTSTILYMPTQYILKRATPTVVSSTAVDSFRIYRNGANDKFNSFSISRASSRSALLFNNSEVFGTGGQAGEVATGASGAYIALDAEL